MTVLLVDANESSPGVARRLGLGLQPHLLDAVDLVARRRHRLGAGPPGAAADLVEAAVRCGRRPAGGVGVAALLTGDARRAGRRARRQWAHTVVDDVADRRGPAPLGRPLRAVPTPAGDRAERVVGVCEATPRGVLRFVDWLADCAATDAVLTVINKVPGLRYSSSEVAEQLRSLCGDRIDVVASAPYRPACRGRRMGRQPCPRRARSPGRCEPLAAAVIAAPAVATRERAGRCDVDEGTFAMTDLAAPPSSNGDTAPPCTHELLRLRVQERLRRDGADDLSVHRTGTRDRRR